MVADASYATNWVSTFLTARKGGARFLEPRGLAGLGWGLPLAMGAKVARPDARVFAIVGDGGFAHCWSELEAARRLKLDVVTIVLNNQILGYQLHGEETLSARRIPTPRSSVRSITRRSRVHAIATASACHRQRRSAPRSNAHWPRDVPPSST